MDAFVKVVRDQGLNFTIQDVADRAGLAARTVYRHFESREALIESISEWWPRWRAAYDLREPETLDEFPAYIEQIFRDSRHMPDRIRAVSMARLVRGEQTDTSRERNARRRRLFEEGLPHLTPAEIDRAFTAARALGSWIGVYVFTAHFGLSGEEAGQAVREALEAQIADLKRRDREAAERKQHPEGDEQSVRGTP